MSATTPTDESKHDPTASEDPHGVPWWLGLAVGGAIFAFGIRGFVEDELQTRPGDWLKWVVGGLFTHDAILAPVAIVAGWLLTRLIPVAVRGGIQATLAVAATVVVMAYPVVKAAGREPDNPSLLPHDYGKNLAIVVAIILVTGVVLTFARAAQRRSRT